MPMVGKMKFAYTEKGKKEAKSYAKKTGKAMTAKPMKKASKPGLYSNIANKRARIKAGSGEKMRKVGSKGAPTAMAFKQSAKTAKKKK
jgi:hypothetical protein